MPWVEEFIKDEKTGAVNGVRLFCSEEMLPIARIEFHIDVQFPQVDLVIVLQPPLTSAIQLAHKMYLDLLPEQFKKYAIIENDKSEDLSYTVLNKSQSNLKSKVEDGRAKLEKDIFGYNPILFRNVSDEDLIILNRILANGEDEKMFVLARNKINLVPVLSSYGRSSRPDPRILVRSNGMRLDDSDLLGARASADDRLEMQALEVDKERDSFLNIFKQLRSEQQAEIEKKIGTCPISGEIIFDPVRVTIGNNTTFFERKHLNYWCAHGVTKNILANGSYVEAIKHPVLNIPFNLETFKSLITDAPEFKKRINNIINRTLKEPPASPDRPSKPNPKPIFKNKG